jgi:uncharacterized sporulation protein YeaH/YhbH (DUF444 family)
METIFKEFQPNSRDRSVEDRRRHKELVEKSIKDNIGSIISEESIIGKSKNKKIKIPIKGLKEYYFKYGKNQKTVVAGTGEEEKGKKISKGDYAKEGSDEGAGNDECEDIYETEITIEDAIHFLFEDLHLPYLQHKKFNEIETQYGSKRSGVRDKGSRAKLSKKHSVIEKIKREKRQKRPIEEIQIDEKEEQRSPFHQEDLKYFYKKPKLKRDSNAVVLCIMRSR